MKGEELKICVLSSPPFSVSYLSYIDDQPSQQYTLTQSKNQFVLQCSGTICVTFRLTVAMYWYVTHNRNSNALNRTGAERHTEQK